MIRAGALGSVFAVLLLAATTTLHANGRLPGATGLAINPADERQLLLGLSYGLALTRDGGANWTIARYTIPRHREIARMTVRLQVRPIGMDVLQSLIDSGDLDAAVIARVPTFTLHGASVEWRPNVPTLRSLLPDTLSCPTE